MARGRKRQAPKAADDVPARPTGDIKWQVQRVWICPKCKGKRHDGEIGEDVICKVCKVAMWRHTWLKAVGRAVDKSDRTQPKSADVSFEPISMERPTQQRNRVPDMWAGVD